MWHFLKLNKWCHINYDVSLANVCVHSTELSWVPGWSGLFGRQEGVSRTQLISWSKETKRSGEMATMLPKMAHFGPRKVRHASFHQRKRSYHHWAIFDLLSLTPMTPWGTIPNTGCLLKATKLFLCAWMCFLAETYQRIVLNWYIIYLQ